METKQVRHNRAFAMGKVAREAAKIAQEMSEPTKGSLTFLDKIKQHNDAYQEQERKAMLLEAHQYDKISSQPAFRKIYNWFIFILFLAIVISLIFGKTNEEQKPEPVYYDESVEIYHEENFEELIIDVTRKRDVFKYMGFEFDTVYI